MEVIGSNPIAPTIFSVGYEPYLPFRASIATLPLASRAKREEIEAEVKAERARLDQKKIRDDERGKNRKVELKAWKRQSKAREEQRKKEGVEAAKRTEASRVSKVKAIISRVNLILSDADVLYSDLKPFRDPRRVNDAEKEQIGNALDAASKLHECETIAAVRLCGRTLTCRASR